MARFVIVADDFTGANDTGVQFSKVGYSAVTIFEPAPVLSDYDVVVIDTETRRASPEEAGKILAKVGVSLNAAGDALIYKKVDSTLRGNIGEEVLRLAESLQSDLVVFAPAFPKMGRTTVGGIHMLNKVPVHLTELAKDPRNPVKTSELRRVLSRSGACEVFSVGLEQIRGDLASYLRGLPLEARFLIFDAEETADLLRIVRGVATLGRRTLWVGSAGLAEAIMLETRNMATTETAREPEKHDRSSTTSAGPQAGVLVVACSVSGLTRRQLFKLLETGKAALVEVNVRVAVKNPSREVRKLVEVLTDRLAAGESIVMASALHEEDVADALEAGTVLGMGSADVSERLVGVVGEACSEAMRRVRPRGLFLTGGDTAYNVLKRTGIYGCRIHGEVEAGVPELVLAGGVLDGLRCITKAGAFGNDETVVHAFNVLQGA